MTTKKQYSKPQVVELGDAVKTTLAWPYGRSREVFLGRKRIFF